MNIKEYIKEQRLITDGAMGTYYEEKYSEDTVIAEKENLKNPEQIKEIHLEYLRAGARLIRTNTFAANTMFLADMQEVKETVRAGYEIAKEAVTTFQAENGKEIPVFIGADLGPIYDLDHQDYDNVLQEYKEICDTFLSCGADCFVFETQSDFTYIEPVTAYIKEKSDAFILVQFAFDKSGYTRSGLSMQRVAVEASEMENVDAYGFNCELDSTHMYQFMKNLKFCSDKFVSALPNAGYPYTLRGKTIYSNNASYYAEKMKDIAALGTDILGGCCGTTPEYIALLSGELQDVPKAAKKIENVVTQEVTRTPSIFEEKLSRGEKAYIVELDPPFSEDASKVMKGAEDLRKCNVDLITLSDSPMARARMDAGQLAVKIQQKTGVAVMPHISCRDRNVIALRAGLLGMHMNDVRHFLIVTGDPVSRADRERVTSVFDFNSIKLMQYVKEMNLEVFAQEPVYYGGALNYHGANPDAIIERMKRKAEAGCGYFLTQPVYTEEDVERLTYIKEHIDTKIMCGIMPLVSYKNATFVKNEMPGIHVSDEIVNRYREDMTREEAEEVAIELSVEIAAKLYDIADGFYFMTPFNRTGLIARIIGAIRQEEERR